MLLVSREITVVEESIPGTKMQLSELPHLPKLLVRPDIIVIITMFFDAIIRIVAAIGSVSLGRMDAALISLFRWSYWQRRPLRVDEHHLCRTISSTASFIINNNEQRRTTTTNNNNTVSVQQWYWCAISFESRSLNQSFIYLFIYLYSFNHLFIRH